MKVREIEIVKFGPIKRFKLSLRDEEKVSIFGSNGAGKSVLCDTIAAIGGTEAATPLLRQRVHLGMTFDFIGMVFEENGLERTIEIRGDGLDLRTLDEKLNLFKQGFTDRVSYAMPENGTDRYVYGLDQCDYDLLAQYLKLLRLNHSVFARSDHMVVLEVGDGYTQFMRLVTALSCGKITNLFDIPERHLDVENMRIMADLFKEADGQVIAVTHAPEFLSVSSMQKNIEQDY